MPTYDYVCGKCGHRFELFQPIVDKPIKKCPSCGANSAKRLIGAGAGLIFRGSGFYCTDYRKGGSGASTPAAPPAADKPDSKSSGSSADGKKKD
jgi:putative FmdB family regulatory protein